MTKKQLKKSSKRTVLSTKYKIQKKVKEHHRKLRKEARKAKSLGIENKGVDKNVRIPNLYPHKKQIIEELQRKKNSGNRKETVEAFEEKLDKANLAEQRDLEGLVYESVQKEKIFRDSMKNYASVTEEEKELKNTEKKDFSKKAYQKELLQVIENSDVILQVLDCRDPLNCRSKELESQILSHKDQKKLILLLNKVDLVPWDNAVAWAKYLRREFPTILFKANTQNQKGNLSSISLYNNSRISKTTISDEILSSNKAVGAENLLELLKNYCRSGEMKKSIVVGLIGFPNVGKSSIINSLTRSRSAGVSAVPGFTKEMQEIILDKTIKLLDCPGVVFNRNDKNSLILKNVLRVEDLHEPEEVVRTLLERVDKATLLEKYEITNFDTCEQFLALVARKRGKLIKTGIPDFDKAARLVIKDWNDGKIPFYTNVPQTEDDPNMVVDK